jgi:Ca-activated chloride channel family protein
MGAGAAAYLSLNDSADEIMAAYFERISHPALTDLKLDFGPMQVTDVFPSRLPDLFVGRPLIITGRFAGAASAVKISGKVGGEVKDFDLPVNEKPTEHRGIASVWARGKIADISDRATWDSNENWEGNIKQVALEYGLMSQFTSFVAVDSSVTTAGSHGTTIAVPVPVPDGVRYETTVTEK